jgi:hypothetical protein
MNVRERNLDALDKEVERRHEWFTPERECVTDERET